MRTIVFFVGRPGSGKSTAARHVARCLATHHVPTIHLNDYDMLRALFLADTEHRRFRPTEGGGFDATDLVVLDEVLGMVERQAWTYLDQPDEGLITVEFARDDYRDAFRHFSPDFLARTHVFYLHTDLELCLWRVHQRVARRLCADDHPSFSDDLFRYHYAQENLAYVRSQLHHDYPVRNVTVIENMASLEDFLRAVERRILPLCGVKSPVSSTPAFS